jgi:hypothetical protein
MHAREVRWMPPGIVVKLMWITYILARVYDEGDAALIVKHARKPRSGKSSQVFVGNRWCVSRYFLGNAPNGF